MPQNQASNCIAPATLQNLLSERLDESEELRIQEHIGGCTTCQQALEDAAGRPELWSEVTEHAEDEPKTDPPRDSVDNSLEMLQALLDPSEDPQRLGRIGPYEICGLVGRGTTGLVMKALEPRLHRFVAIKLMSPSYQDNGSARSRFEREGRAIAAVSHEHVVPIYAVDDHRGLPYIVMKYIPGLSLEERLERDGPLDGFELARIGLQVAKGLAAAHDQGIVHRDVKPANVILEATVERAMVTDFGLARVVDEASMTRSGTISGTPQFMSPEQARGNALDYRSDLFSLGSLMYNAATGRAPFRAETVFGVIHRVCDSEPRPIRETNPRIEDWMAAFIDRLMAKDPEDRFESANEAASVLSAELAYMQNPTVAACPPRDWIRTDPAGNGDAGRDESHRRTAWLPLGMAVATGLLVWSVGFTERGEELRASLAPKWAALWNQDIPSGGAEESAASLGLEDLGRIVTNEGSRTLYQRTRDETFAVTPGGKFTVRLDQGNVELAPSTTGSLRVQVEHQAWAEQATSATAILDAHPYHLQLTDGVLDVHDRAESPVATADLAGALHAVHYRFEVPAGVEIDLHATNGGVLIGDLACDVAVEAGGNILVGHVTGEISARANGGNIEMLSGNEQEAQLLTVGGDIHVAGSNGGAWARTSNGDIYLGKNSGATSAQTSGGDIHVDGILATTAAFAESGNVYVTVATPPTELTLFGATGGDVHVALAEDMGATVHARGSIESELPFETEHPESGREPYQACSVLEGSAAIQLTSTTGTIHVMTSADIVASTAADGPSQGEPSTEGPNADGPSENGPSTDSPSETGLGGSGLGGSGLGGSGLGGSGLGGSGLGGSGHAQGSTPGLSAEAIARTMGAPRPGALATVVFDEPTGNIDGYTLYLPISHAEREGPFPILVYLQGAFGVGGRVADVNNWGLTRLLRDETDMTLERNRLLLDEFIVLNVHISTGNYYEQPDVLGAILDELIADFKGDPNRITATGLSVGGSGSWGLAAAMGDRLAAIAPMAGRSGSAPEPDAFGDMGIWIGHNTTDRVIEYEQSQVLAESIEEATGQEFLRVHPADLATSEYLGSKYVFTSATSGGHDAWTDIYRSAEFFLWLQRQTRE